MDSWWGYSSINKNHAFPRNSTRLLCISSPSVVGCQNIMACALHKLPKPQGSHSMSEDETITKLVHAVQRKWCVLVPGQPLVVQDIPSSQFPLTLAFSGDNQATLQLIPDGITAAIKTCCSTMSQVLCFKSLCSQGFFVEFDSLPDLSTKQKTLRVVGHLIGKSRIYFRDSRK